jgi:ubiquinone/menaquinone biosynthesis C-methylase UbiE
METVNSSSVFDQFSRDYDSWYDDHASLFQSEILALQKAVPSKGRGLEVGVGTGRFAQALKISDGVEPSHAMAKLAINRGIKVVSGVGEDLPYPNGIFDFVVMITTVCFLIDIPKALKEAYRVIGKKGYIILAIIDKESHLGRKYQHEKSSSKFYKDAHFFSTEEVSQYLTEAGFSSLKYWQTLSELHLESPEQPEPGYGKGGFVVIKARKR